jgi:hypothetical protein
MLQGDSCGAAGAVSAVASHLTAGAAVERAVQQHAGGKNQHVEQLERRGGIQVGTLPLFHLAFSDQEYFTLGQFK